MNDNVIANNLILYVMDSSKKIHKHVVFNYFTINRSNEK
jgi:hypothetical protein